MITVFFDGKCSLCAREIRHYQKIAPDGVFNWQDITIDTKQLESCGVSYIEALRLLHVLDEKEKLHIGVNAFIVIWRQLKRWRWLAYIVRLPILHQLVAIIYRLFAHWRFKRLKHCRLVD